MDDETHEALRREHPALGPIVESLLARDVDRDEAWLIAGALVAYTGNAGIPARILRAVEDEDRSFPKRVGKLNEKLRSSAALDQDMVNLLDLLRGIEKLPDWGSAHSDPTRMMDPYEGIDEDYAVGNVVIMGEVGSVGRGCPSGDLYRRRYRLHFQGGLKDVTALNPEQREVIYAPGSAYLVERRRTGKVKGRKGNQAHEHIYLSFVARQSQEYRNAVENDRIVDLSHGRFG